MTLLFRRTLVLLLSLSLLTVGPLPGAFTPEAHSRENLRYAAIVVDAQTGEVMFARHADSRRYPASITKVMTLYLVFEAITEGRIQLDDVIRVSPRAASQPPSKLGLAAGQTITVADAIQATALRSANDMATALAEHVAGSEARFAAMMTLKAESLGMTNSRFVNANGLPDSRQITTARDLTVLSRAVMRDYPQYYRFFGVSSWTYQGRDYRNTNGLLSSGRGYDGIKTGYINASGYNLAASAVRDGRRLITVVLGGRSSATRNAHVAELMDTGFEIAAKRAGGERIEVAQLYFEQKGYGIGPTPVPSAPPVVYASVTSEPPAPLAQAMGDRDPDVVLTSGPAVLPSSTTASLNSGTPARRPAASSWSVQVGAFRDRTVAADWLTEVNRRFRSTFRGSGQSVEEASGWYRSRFTGFTEADARAACETLSARNVTCMVVRPD
jgi:D-alanyl-D-alanine carboxypeptidase (penicillin-binding protein 5/6)